MKNNKMLLLLKGIILENPVLVLVLGTCPTLAISTSVIGAISMGIAATLVLIGSNLVISLLRKIIPDTVRIPCYIVIIAAFVTIVQMLLKAYLAPLYDLMGVYLALIVVNCIILARAEMFASKNSVADSVIDGLGTGVGFLVALLAMALIREPFGAGTITVIPDNPFEIPFLIDFKIPMLVQAPGGFLVFGILIAIINKLGVKPGAEKRTKQISCDNCPSAAICAKTSCSDMAEITAEIADTEANKNSTEGEDN